MVVHTTSAQ